MGTYCTITSIWNNSLYGINTSTANSATLINYVTKAEALVNSYVAGNYTLPFAAGAVPELLGVLTEDLVVARVWLDLFPNDNVSQNEWVKSKYTDAMAMLEKIGDGTIKLTASNTLVDTAKDDVYVSSHLDYPLPINLDSEWNWEPAGKLIDDIEDARDAADS